MLEVQPDYSKYKSIAGFTLVELLTTMTIVAVILGLSASGFIGLRTTMILKQSAETMKSDIMYAKRAAMLVKREQGEHWINGVGIDLASMSLEDNAYRMFKYCGDDDTYHPFANEDIGYVISLVENPPECYGSCESSGVSEFTSVPGYDKVQPSSTTVNFLVDRSVRIIFFESPTGKLHLYDCDGSEIILDDQDDDIFLIFELLRGIE